MPLMPRAGTPTLDTVKPAGIIVALMIGKPVSQMIRARLVKRVFSQFDVSCSKRIPIV